MSFIDETMGINGIFLSKEDEEFTTNGVEKLSIADRRPGFDASSLLPCGFGLQLQTTNVFTVPPGINPSDLLDPPNDSSDSPVMLPNAQGQSSPTTGRCSFSSNYDSISAEYMQETIAKTENNWEQPNCKTNNNGNGSKLLNHQEQKQPQQQKCWEDGYLWRKYGQKQVKGSEFPRSYYKCTSTNCDVTKKVERSLDGQISEMVYKGSHNHPPVRKDETPDSMNIITDHVSSDDDVGQLDAPINENDIQTTNEQQRQLDHGGDDDQTFYVNVDLKRRKIRESLTAGPSHETTSTATNTARTGREPKIVVQVESEIDILEDGFRWRKYGQKVVKGNPNPRSYYKCTSPDCFVRKHVERAADDIKSVVITYEGKHNHGLPTSSRSNNSSVVLSADNITTGITNPTPSTMSMPILMPQTKSSVNRVQDQRPLYLQERKPILNYNEFMASNLTSSYGPPFYPYSFSTNFHSLPSYSRAPFIMNNNIPMNNYPVVNPNCMSMSLPLDPNFHYTNYVQPMQPQGQEIKEEPKDHENKIVYDDHTCLPLPNYGR